MAGAVPRMRRKTAKEQALVTEWRRWKVNGEQEGCHPRVLNSNAERGERLEEQTQLHGREQSRSARAKQGGLPRRTAPHPSRKEYQLRTGSRHRQSRSGKRKKSRSGAGLSIRFRSALYSDGVARYLSF